MVAEGDRGVEGEGMGVTSSGLKMAVGNVGPEGKGGRPNQGVKEL